jgi:hypothetical protein
MGYTETSFGESQPQNRSKSGETWNYDVFPPFRKRGFTRHLILGVAIAINNK